MNAWGISSGSTARLSEIMAEEEAAQKSSCQEEDELSRAIAASLALDEDTTARSNQDDDESLSLALALSLQEDENDSSLALALQLEEQVKGARVEAQRSAERRAASARHERVRLVSRFDEEEKTPCCAADEIIENVGIDQLLEREGIETDHDLGPGIIGRRCNGALVSKHDLSLDGRLKAQILQDNFHSAGDIKDERIPGRVFNDLRRKSCDRHLAAVPSRDLFKKKHRPNPETMFLHLLLRYNTVFYHAYDNM